MLIDHSLTSVKSSTLCPILKCLLLLASTFCCKKQKYDNTKPVIHHLRQKLHTDSKVTSNRYHYTRQSFSTFLVLGMWKAPQNTRKRKTQLKNSTLAFIVCNSRTQRALDVPDFPQILVKLSYFCIQVQTWDTELSRSAELQCST